MKGQVSIERLSVYGWAIAIILALTFALYSLGLTKPCKWTGTQISGFGGFSLSSVKMNLSSGRNILVFRLTNNMESSVTIKENGIEMTDSEGYKGNSTNPPVTLSSYQSEIFTIKQYEGEAFRRGECYRVNLLINYYQGDVEHQARGSIYGVVEA